MLLQHLFTLVSSSMAETNRWAKRLSHCCWELAGQVLLPTIFLKSNFILVLHLYHFQCSEEAGPDLLMFMGDWQLLSTLARKIGAWLLVLKKCERGWEAWQVSLGLANKMWEQWHCPTLSHTGCSGVSPGALGKGAEILPGDFSVCLFSSFAVRPQTPGPTKERI